MNNINKIHCGDCIETLKKIESNSVDSIVTDPPYELGFMGKKWDNTGIANNVEMWQECLRVLKPGGHLLAFSGTRTYHRMASAIEDAGFEVRDMIEWVYSTGFPKSLNIGKAVDKINGLFGEKEKECKKYLRDSWEKSGKKQKDLAYAMGDFTTGGGRISHYLGEKGLIMPKWDDWVVLKAELNLDDRYDDVIKEAEREVIGKTKSGGADAWINGVSKNGENTSQQEWDITKGTSEWEGWGTALKPAHEPICMARKPLSEKTVAENCLKWGTGGINIDESRVGTEDMLGRKNNVNPYGSGRTWSVSNTPPQDNTENPPTGRFPANLLHDGSEEVRECFPNASERFFKSIIYQAKASKSERNKGCEDVITRENDVERKGNIHSTVKPITLMEYLITMVTPKGGVVLDPFAGSGTTGVACKNLNINFILIEKEPEYCKIAEARINK